MFGASRGHVALGLALWVGALFCLLSVVCSIAAGYLDKVCCVVVLTQCVAVGFLFSSPTSSAGSAPRG